MNEQLEDKHHRVTAEELLRQLQNARRQTLSFVTDLDDAQFEFECRDTLNPFLWELGHVGFFYEGFLLRILHQLEPLAIDGDEKFNSFEVHHCDRWDLQFPPPAETFDYLANVAGRVAARLENRTPDARETYLHLLAVRHEDMHGEAFLHMRQTLEYGAPPVLSSRSAAADPSQHRESGPLGDVKIPGRTFQLGAAPEAPFMFDNEKWQHSVEVPTFSISRTAVTQAEFAAFVEDGGYNHPKFWSRSGWKWREDQGASHPAYWSPGADGWRRRQFDRWVPLEPTLPVVHVNWYEAEAFCRWAGRRLPTEAEWELAASGDSKSNYPWGNHPPTPELANLDASHQGCVDVAAFAAGDSLFGCRQMTGNVWEWTASAFYPYDGFVVDYPYKEYSAPWFGRPKVLRGGAWSTRSRIAYSTFRNFFDPDRNDLFAGFRTCAL